MLPEDIDGAWDTWQWEFLKIMEQTIPNSTLLNRRNVPRLNKSIVQALGRGTDCTVTRILDVLTIMPSYEDVHKGL